MSRALSESLAWIKRQAFSYLVILAILLAGSWLVTKYREEAALRAELAQADALVQQDRLRLAEAQERAGRADEAVTGQLAAMRRARDLAQQELAAKEQEREAHRLRHWPWAGLHGPVPLAESRLLDEQVQALRRAAHAAQSALETAQALQQSASALQALQEQARRKRAEADRLRAQWRRLSAANPIAQRFPGAPVRAELDRLKVEVERLQDEAVQVERAIAAAARSREVARMLRERAALAAAQASLRESEARRSGVAQSLERSAWRRVQAELRAFFEDKKRLFVAAFLLLLAALASRLLVKLFLYYVVAPLASRRPAVRLVGAHEARAFAQPVLQQGPGRISAESIDLHLPPGDELLVRPEYLQSSPERAAKRTAWLLNPALPFTSILSGLYLLTRVRSEEGAGIVLSPVHDPFEELCLVDLPPGAALVSQPRALAGVVQAQGRRVRVTRHWRLASLHAWLTFQLRFLVFHGPCRLVLKGSRGVRMEPAGGGRLINQVATLAFDASVPYGTARTETFVPYWLGKEGLFDDRFGGVDGSYLYEERSLDRRGNALTGRGLEGLADGVLRLFGI